MKKANVFENTVFILGAGASKPYGLPIGKDLKDEIISLQHQHPDKSQSPSHRRHAWFLNRLKDLKFTSEDVIRFCEDFHSTGSESIDVFLQAYMEEKHDYFKLGRLIIYYLISSKEVLHSLQRADWVDELVQYFMQTDYRESFLKAPPKFISFNYDNHLKNKIEFNLARKYLIKDHKINSVTNIYGCTSEIRYGMTYEDYAEVDDFEDLEKFCEGLSLIREDISKSDEAKEIQKIIKNSEKVVILGYGFDPINNKILFKNEDNLKKMITEERIHATGFELDDRIIKKLNGYAYQKGSYRPLRQQKCLEMIREMIPKDLF